MIDLTELNDGELDRLHVDLLNEQKRRYTLNTAQETIDTTIVDYQTAIGRVDGDQWVQPTGYLDAYLKGAVVTRDGKTWVSNIDGNTLEPGVSGWSEQVAEGEPPAEYKKPEGYQDAYSEGDLVTFEGNVYESVIDGNSWSPTEAPQHWADHGPVNNYEP